MMIDVILLWHIHFSALSNSNGAFLSPLKSRDRWLKILFNEWSEIFNSNWALKTQRERELRFARQVLSETFKAKLNNNNIKLRARSAQF